MKIFLSMTVQGLNMTSLPQGDRVNDFVTVVIKKGQELCDYINGRPINAVFALD